MFGTLATIALYVVIQTVTVLVQAGFLKVLVTLVAILIGLACIIHCAQFASFFYFRFRSNSQHPRVTQENESRDRMKERLRPDAIDEAIPTALERYKTGILQNNDHCSKEKLEALVQKFYALP